MYSQINFASPVFVRHNELPFTWLVLEPATYDNYNEYVKEKMTLLKALKDNNQKVLHSKYKYRYQNGTVGESLDEINEDRMEIVLNYLRKEQGDLIPFYLNVIRNQDKLVFIKEDVTKEVFTVLFLKYSLVVVFKDRSHLVIESVVSITPQTLELSSGEFLVIGD